MLEVWQPQLSPGNLHVVTVPPRGSDPDLLWTRFAGVVGVDPGVCSEGIDASNPSLGHASTELVRHVNVELGKVPRAHYDLIVKRQLARGILGARSGLEPPVRLNRRGHRLAARWNKRVLAAIDESEAALVGARGDLPTRMPGKSVPKAMHRPTPAELLAAAATARDGLLELQSRLQLEREALGHLAVASHGVTAPDHWDSDPEPVPAAVRELTDLVRGCITVATADGGVGTP
jgi:hypothetical protein